MLERLKGLGINKHVLGFSGLKRVIEDLKTRMTSLGKKDWGKGNGEHFKPG
jgi:hypothetical protein